MLIREVTQPPDPAQRQIASLGDQVKRLRQQQQRLRAQRRIASLGDQVNRLRQQQQRLRAQRRIRQGRTALAKAASQ